MRIDRRIARRASQGITLFHGNMLAIAWILKQFRQSEIDDEHGMTITTTAHEEVVRFDIAMDQFTRVVNRLDATDQLTGDDRYRLQAELAPTVIKQIF